MKAEDVKTEAVTALMCGERLYGSQLGRRGKDGPTVPGFYACV